MTTQYTVTQSAKTLGISVSNLKRTADDFQTVLPDYETTQGQRRTFTDADLRAHVPRC
jgi:DNA-binding transcriptional MerR regulator